MDKIRKERPREVESCANCGKPVSNYSSLSAAIMNQKPACSYECNKALGQVK